MPLRKSPVRTPALLAANRANAQKSTGPRTPRGKARVSFNSFKHGRYAAQPEDLAERLLRAGYGREAALYRQVRWQIGQIFRPHGDAGWNRLYRLSAWVWRFRSRLGRRGPKPECALISCGEAPRVMSRTRIRVEGPYRRIGIITAETGVPITPLIGGDPLGLKSGDAWAYPDRLAGCSTVNSGTINSYINANCYALPTAMPEIAASCTPFASASVPGTCKNLMGNSGRNSVVGPGLATFDFSMFKNNYIRRISENFNVQFRAEFFNLLNRPNFGTPVDNSTMFDSKGNPVGGAGALDNLSTSARQIQFALKLIW
jgi:hypothetical protein